MSARYVPLDIIIGATGYDGLTRAMMAGFPNFFVIARANEPSALANFVILDEQNVDWIWRCIAHLNDTARRPSSRSPRRRSNI